MLDRRVGKIGGATTALPPSRFGLGHTRWATHGAVHTENAHPQLDCTRRLALVHNGMLTNETELRDALVRSGHAVRSQTDSELIAHLIEDLLEQTPPGSDRLVRATMAAFRKLRGLNAVAVLDVRTGEIAAAKNGTPLVLGVARGGHFLASDHTGLLEHTREVAFVHDGQAVSITRTHARLFDLQTGDELRPELTTLTWDEASSDRGAHPDYMSKEISEQPAVLRAIARAPHAGIEALAARVAAADEVVIDRLRQRGSCCAHGPASARARGGAAHFGRHGPRARPTAAVHQCEHARDRALAERRDRRRARRGARGTGARRAIAALTNVEGSSLWRTADLTVPLAVGPERCVLATKSFSAKLALLLLLAHTLAGDVKTGCRLLEAVASDLDDMLHGPRRGAIREIARAIQSTASTCT